MRIWEGGKDSLGLKKGHTEVLTMEFQPEDCVNIPPVDPPVVALPWRFY